MRWESFIFFLLANSQQEQAVRKENGQVSDSQPLPSPCSAEVLVKTWMNSILNRIFRGLSLGSWFQTGKEESPEATGETVL